MFSFTNQILVRVTIFNNSKTNPPNAMKFGIQGYFDNLRHVADFRHASCTRSWFPWQRYFSPFWAKKITLAEKDNLGTLFSYEANKLSQQNLAHRSINTVAPKNVNRRSALNHSHCHGGHFVPIPQFWDKISKF